ncbi:MAG: UDP-N-acetylmuramoyl-tripeptide--D-alanyl-D-alanine ligase [bacterium]|nr:UDP-N-acetylmuramoyl-tripeptide--D-alanyl-D-alanine ligase [bacterium]
MEPVTLKEIIRWTDGQTANIQNEMIFEGICTDSRSTTTGSLFIALKGKNFDGHDFVCDAIKAGATAVLSEKLLHHKIPQIIVKCTLTALGDIAKNYRRKFSVPIIGITGSDGKTTTKEMCWHLLSSKFNVCKNQGNFNNEIGLPLSIFSMTKNTEIGIFELGMNGSGQLRYLSSILQPDIAIITSIGYAHLGFFKSRAELAAAKSEILEHISPDGLAVVNGDTGFLNFFSGRTFVPPVRVGLKHNSDFQGILTGYDGKGFVLKIDGWRNFEFRINSWNGAIAYPALFSIFISDYFGIQRNRIEKLVRDFVLIEGRGHLKEQNGIRILDESYNANPGSMKMALHYFTKQHARRKIAIIGAMAELGKWSKLYHKKIGNILKNSTCDAVFTTGEDAKIISELCGKKSKHFENVDDLAIYVCKFVKKGDLLLVKGSRFNKLEIVINKLMEKLER